MRDKHKQAFQKYVSRLVKDVVLFGSVARGEHGVNSDVGVLITVSDLSEREEIENLAYEITGETGVSISPLIVKDSTEKKDILQTIEQEGKAMSEVDDEIKLARGSFPRKILTEKHH